MNQILKDSVYGLGTQKQIDYMAEIGGMNDEERKFFQLVHERKSDQFIQDELGLSRRSFDRVQSAVKAKLTIAIFSCINKSMELS